MSQYLRACPLYQVRERAGVVVVAVRNDDLAQVAGLPSCCLDRGEDAVGAAGEAGIDQRQPVRLRVEVRPADAEAVDRVYAFDNLHA